MEIVGIAPQARSHCLLRRCVRLKDPAHRAEKIFTIPRLASAADLAMPEVSRRRRLCSARCARRTIIARTGPIPVLPSRSPARPRQRGWLERIRPVRPVLTMIH